MRLFISAILLLCAAYLLYLAAPKQDHMRDRHGRLADVSYESAEQEGAISGYVSLRSSSGLAVDVRVLRPQVSDPLPVVLLLGGYRTGKHAVDLAGLNDRIGFVAIDYPYTGAEHISGFRQSVAAIDDVQDAFLDTPPALWLTMDWLQQQPWVDRDRIELVGVSLGVPFAAAAAALDTRFKRVWLLHGGGDNVSWAAHAGRNAIDNEFLRRLTARGLLLLVHGGSFDTPQWITETAPRPVVIVAAQNDDYVPAESLQPMVEAAEQAHVEFIWTEGRHIRPERPEELQQLLNIVLTRL